MTLDFVSLSPLSSSVAEEETERTRIRLGGGDCLEWRKDCLQRLQMKGEGRMLVRKAFTAVCSVGSGEGMSV